MSNKRIEIEERIDELIDEIKNDSHFSPGDKNELQIMIGCVYSLGEIQSKIHEIENLLIQFKEEL